MNRTVSVVYALLVIVVLIGVIGFFGWQTYDSRSRRIADFTVRTKEYTKLLSDSLMNQRDVKAEVEIAEQLMANDPTLVAVQVYAQSDGLRLSVVKPVVGDFRSTALSGTDHFDTFFARIRYHMVSRPMTVEGMAGLEAYFVSATLTSAELRNNLFIVLITVGGLFVITLGMVFIRPARTEPDHDGDMDEHTEEEFSLPDGFDDAPTDVGMDDISLDETDDFGLPDFDDVDRLDESDLWGSNPEIGNSLPMEDDFDIPDLDDFQSPESEVDLRTNFLDCLEQEIEKAASLNQDLSLIVFFTGENEGEILNSFDLQDLVFDLDGGKFGVIKINKTLDQAIATTEDIVRNRIKETGLRSTRAGIASRNGRLISADRLWNEAESALKKTDKSKNIVAFRANPEKYRQFLKDERD